VKWSLRLKEKKSEQSLLTEQQKQRTADDFQVAATTTTTEPTTTTTTTADAATTATDANYVYGIPEAASAAYGHLISENVITHALLFCLQPLVINLENFVVLLHDYKKWLLVPKISGTSSLKLLQSCMFCLHGRLYL